MRYHADTLLLLAPADSQAESGKTAPGSPRRCAGALARLAMSRAASGGVENFDRSGR